MPRWAQMLTFPNPFAAIIAVSRKVLLKGSGFAGVQQGVLRLAVLAGVFNALAVYSYRKQG